VEQGVFQQISLEMKWRKEPVKQEKYTKIGPETWGWSSASTSQKKRRSWIRWRDLPLRSKIMYHNLFCFNKNNSRESESDDGEVALIFLRGHPKYNQSKSNPANEADFKDFDTYGTKWCSCCKDRQEMDNHSWNGAVAEILSSCLSLQKGPSNHRKNETLQGREFQGGFTLHRGQRL